MTIVIDPAFSVFHLVQRTQQHKQFIRHRRTMSQISFELEDSARESGRYTRVFAGFQYLSRYLPQVERYRRIAENNESVYVFGVPDVDVPPIDNITYVNLSATDQLAKEWFVIGYGRNFASALATEEITHITDPDEKRQFQGVWTFNPLIVSIIGDWVSSAVDARPIKSEVDDVTHQHHVSGVIRSIERMIEQIDRTQSDKMNARLLTIRQELETLMNEELQPSATRTT